MTEPKPCACGCGEPAQKTYVQGHDQKLRVALERQMKAAGHQNGLLAIAGLVRHYVGSKRARQ